MKFVKLKLAVLGAAVLLASCGGSDGGIEVNNTVSFGDSLSDVGTYKVGTIAALGGGKWTINSATSMNWTEIVAGSVRTPAPCAAQTGLLVNIPGLTGAAVTNHANCFNYAQGSSRVSKLFAPNSATLQAAPFSQQNLGLLAVPITTQMSTHLAKMGGSYTGRELVTIMGGGNDIFMNLAGVGSAATGGATAVGAAIAAGWSADVQNAVAAGGTAAVNAAATAAVTSMGQAGAELAGLVKTQVLAKGARYVVVVNLPDVTQTPFAQLSLDATTRGLLGNMVTTFNSQLQAGLSGSAALYVDAYTQGRDQYANPAKYGITNVTMTACDPASPANPLAGSSITCTAASTFPGSTGYAFADSVHPSPLGYQLLGEFVIAQMRAAGWI